MTVQPCNHPLQVIFGKIDPKTIRPEIQLDPWAGITIPNLMMRGYQRLGG